MRISVVMCTYNGARFLAEQLDSLLGQTRLPDEIIISDDVSTDGTLAILEGFLPRAKALGINAGLVRNPMNLGYVVRQYSLWDRMAGRRSRKSDYMAALALRLQGLLDWSHRSGFTLPGDLVEDVQARISHASIRAALPENPSQRMRVVFGEWMNGRYSMFSSGIRSIVSDLLRWH